MAYQIKALPFAEGSMCYLKYRIYNSAGSFVELSELGASVKAISVHKGDNDEPLEMMVPAESGYLRFFVNEIELPTQTLCWKLADRGENQLTFSSDWPSVKLQLRYTWMDHERLVIDVSADADPSVHLSCTSHFPFSLGDQGTGPFFLNIFCQSPSSETAAPSSILKFPTDGIFTVPSGGLYPTSELISLQGDMTVTAYTTFPQLHVVADSPSKGVCLNMELLAHCQNTPVSHRIIYGFDPVYHGPAKVSPVLF